LNLPSARVSRSDLFSRPAVCARHLKASLVFGSRTTVLSQKRPIDQFDEDPAVLRRFDRIGDLDQLARGFLGIGIGANRRRISSARSDRLV
jgi:hypothetical protein